MTEKTKPCRDCKWVSKNPFMHHTRWKCRHKESITHEGVVSGIIYYSDCAWARDICGRCKKEGILFEPEQGVVQRFVDWVWGVQE
jgi:hypothetical protein